MLNDRILGATAVLFHGANVNHVTPEQQTPLHFAAYENSRHIAEVLLAFGADPMARNDRNQRPFDVGLFDMIKPPRQME